MTQPYYKHCGILRRCSVFTTSSRETPGQLQGSKTSKPETPRKKTRKLPPRPQPRTPWKKLNKYSKYPKNTIFRAFLVFIYIRLFFNEFGVGARGVIFEFFSRSFGFRGFGALYGRFSHLPPYLLRCALWEERCLWNQGEWCPRKGVAIASHCAIVNWLRYPERRKRTTMRAGTDAFRIPGDFVTYAYSYWIRIHWPRTFFTYVYSYLLQGKFLRRARGTCI